MTRTPARTRYNSSKVIADVGDLRGSWPGDEPSCVVWFDRVNKTFLFGLDELRSVADVQETARFNDGGVYVVTKHP
jgi:hypothetical protein